MVEQKSGLAASKLTPKISATAWRSARSLAPEESQGRSQSMSPAPYLALEKQLRVHHDASLAEHLVL